MLARSQLLALLMEFPPVVLDITIQNFMDLILRPRPLGGRGRDTPLERSINTLMQIMKCAHTPCAPEGELRKRSIAKSVMAAVLVVEGVRYQFSPALALLILNPWNSIDADTRCAQLFRREACSFHSWSPIDANARLHYRVFTVPGEQHPRCCECGKPRYPLLPDAACHDCGEPRYPLLPDAAEERIPRYGRRRSASTSECVGCGVRGSLADLLCWHRDAAPPRRTSSTPARLRAAR